MSLQRVKLGDLGSWGSGGTPLASKREYYGGNIPWLIIEDLNDGIVSRSARSITLAGLESSSAKVVPPGTLLIAMYGSIGKLGITEISCATNQAIAYCKCDPSRVDAKFLFFLLLHERARFLRAGRGGTQQNISQEFLKDYEIHLPALSEQRRIAGLLEQTVRLRRTRHYVLNLSDAFLHAVFVSLFGNPAKNPKYPLVSLSELIVSGPQNGLYKPATAYGSGTRIVRIDAYQNNFAIKFAELQRVRLSSDEIATYGLLKGDFLINRVNSRSHLGKSTVVPQLSEPAVYESNMMRFRVDEKRLNPVYVAQLLHTPFINEQIQKRAKDASNQSSINQEDVESFAVLLPPLAAQHRFAALVLKHECLRASQREALRQIDHLFQSLLDRAFR